MLTDFENYFFRWHAQQEIANKVVVRHLVSPQTCRTLWSVKNELEWLLVRKVDAEWIVQKHGIKTLNRRRYSLE